MSGQLFKQYFLTDGIRETPEWKDSVKQAEAFSGFIHAISTCFDNFSHFNNPNEAVTEKELICPVLEVLGWADQLPQQGAARNEEIPDYLLFAGDNEKNKAIARENPQDRFKDALVVLESKRLGRSLDSRTENEHAQEQKSRHGWPLTLYLAVRPARSKYVMARPMRRYCATCQLLKLFRMATFAGAFSPMAVSGDFTISALVRARPVSLNVTSGVS